MLIGAGFADKFLSESETRELMATALSKASLDGKRVLILIPDGTRTAPIPMMFRLFHELLGRRAAALDYLIALGTHQPMSEEHINRHLGVTAEERAGTYANVRVFNHRWDLPETFAELGEISAEEIAEISGGRLHEAVKVRLNKLALDYDQLIICGPVFPHEVVGFSGGNKYFFPGISGGEVINFSHWLGALITSYEMIGLKHTPVRQVINRAASFIHKPKLCFAMVVKGDSLAGLYISTPEEAWDAASDLSSQLHVVWRDKPYRRVLSVMPKLYDDLWTGSKGMYKLEPVIADGGEVVIYAPHIDEVSYTHGKIIDELGYHVLEYFTKQWDKFKHYPLGVVAHSTHLRGIGSYDAETGIEYPRIKVTLATGIPRERCERLNLGYLDPNSIRLEDWQSREDEGILLVPKAGEMLYRLKPQAAHA
ncbi:MAG TPA: lactate racemase domain-containing protein [Blastocatellia bacterium]|nr:lactate racemase domain-containing protein [Blastocatellia bacterium]HMV83086.1 lactate racemase domain-containing protein [Blastocatellia bacterium]HMZ18284.1 lactate racemase domain-containing protein [Blastocatellia bacterium]HNG30983.1 lactate racemase domain-containing protein [Blastocatellia bacterium]